MVTKWLFGSDMAKRRVAKLDIVALQSIFDNWFERNQKKIAAKYRDEIKTSANKLFENLHRLKG